MPTLMLDRDTVDRLLAGTVPPDDAPPGFAGVAELIRSCAQLPPPDRAMEQTTILAMTQQIRSTSEPSAPRGVVIGGHLRLKLVAIGVGVLLVGMSGLAFAGELPEPMQRIAHTVFASLGIDIPAPSAAPRPIRPSMVAPTAANDEPDSRVATDPAGSTAEQGASGSSAGAHEQSHPDEPTEQTDQPHGQSDQPHGQSDEPHGQSDEPHGQSDEPHGQSDEPHGQSDEPHGQSDRAARAVRSAARAVRSAARAVRSAARSVR